MLSDYEQKILYTFIRRISRGIFQCGRVRAWQYNETGTSAEVPTFIFYLCVYAVFLSFLCFMQVTALMSVTSRQNAEIEMNTTDQPSFSLIKP